MAISLRDYAYILLSSLRATASSGRNAVDALVAIYDEHGIPFDITANKECGYIQIKTIDKNSGEIYNVSIIDSDVVEHYIKSYVAWRKKRKKKGG